MEKEKSWFRIFCEEIVVIIIYAVFTIVFEMVESKNKFLYDLLLLIFACGTTILTYIMIRYIINFKKNKEKIFNRNPDSVIDPILAESIIDRQINFKELIITFILNLSQKGKIKIINNDRLKLINEKELLDYEKEFISIFFSYLGQEISLKDFSNNIKNKERLEIVKNKLLNIKRGINNKLFLDGYYDYYKEKNILGFFRKFTIILMAFCIIAIISTIMEINFFKSIIIFVLYLIIPLLGILDNNKENDPIHFMKIDEKNIDILLVFSIYLIPIALVLKYDIENTLDVYKCRYIIFYIIIIIFNMVSFFVTFMHVFTEKGKDAYEKAIGLKKYLKEYSLMRERNIKEIELWDEYIVYSAAFGISTETYEKLSSSIAIENKILKILNRVL